MQSVTTHRSVAPSRLRNVRASALAAAQNRWVPKTLRPTPTKLLCRARSSCEQCQTFRLAPPPPPELRRQNRCHRTQSLRHDDTRRPAPSAFRRATPAARNSTQDPATCNRRWCAHRDCSQPRIRKREVRTNPLLQRSPQYSRIRAEIPSSRDAPNKLIAAECCTTHEHHYRFPAMSRSMSAAVSKNC